MRSTKGTLAGLLVIAAVAAAPSAVMADAPGSITTKETGATLTTTGTGSTTTQPTPLPGARCGPAYARIICGTDW